MKSIFEKLIAVLVLSAFVLSAIAQDESNESEEEEAKTEETKTIAELTESSERIEGLFTLVRDSETGELQMLIKQDQIDQEFI